MWRKLWTVHTDQLIFELLLHASWTTNGPCVGSAHLKTEPVHTSEPICRTNKSLDAVYHIVPLSDPHITHIEPILVLSPNHLQKPPGPHVQITSWAHVGPIYFTIKAPYGAHIWPLLINHIGPIRKPFAKTDWGPYRAPTKAPYKNPFGTLVGLICSAGWVIGLLKDCSD